MQDASSRARNREQTFHSAPDTAKPTPGCWGPPDPQRDQPLGGCKRNGGCIPAWKTSGREEECSSWEEERSGRRSEEGGGRTPAAQWLAGDQLGSSDLLFTLQEELEAVENIGVSLSLAREPCFMGACALAELKLGGAVASPRGLLRSVFI